MLVVGAAWWSSWAFDSRSYCEKHNIDPCADGGFELPLVYLSWVVTFVASQIVCAVAVLTSPSQPRSRLVWALMMGASVFVANRNNLIWALVITSPVVWLVARGDADQPAVTRAGHGQPRP